MDGNQSSCMSEKEKILLCKTSNILNKDTSQMKLNDIIEELVQIIEATGDTNSVKENADIY